MDDFWIMAVMILVFFVVVILWFQYWMDIVGRMQFALLAEKNHDLLSQQFWKFISTSILVFLLAGCDEIVISYFDPHYPVYRSPLGIVCVLLVNLWIGLGFGFFLWIFAAIGVPRGAFWPLSEDEKEAGKKFFWKRRLFDRLNLEEKIYLRKASSLRGLLLSLIGGYVSLFLALAFILLFGGLGVAAAKAGFSPFSEEKFHVDPTRPKVSGREILEVIFLVATALGFFPWLFAQIQAWRFLGKKQIVGDAVSNTGE